MIYQPTKITSSEANNLFSESSMPLESFILAATTRYISIKRANGDMDNIKPIKVFHSTFTAYDSGDGFANNVETQGFDDFEIIIITKKSGDTLPCITLDNWVSLDSPPYPVAPFLSKFSETRVYLNTEKQKAIIFVKTATENWIDAFCSSLFRIIPWRFQDGVIADDEKSLFQAINKKDFGKFTELIDKLCESIDFKSIATKKALFGWTTAFKKDQIRILEERIISEKSMIQRKEEELARYYNELSDSLLKCKALVLVETGSDYDLCEYFDSRKQIGVHSVNAMSGGGKSLQYYIVETLDYYDKDEFIEQYKNTSSTFNLNATPEIKEIFKAIFIEQKGKFRVDCVFKLDNLSSLTVVRGARPNGTSYKNLPHPHLVNYGCLGANQTPINKFMLNGDWELALDQTIAAAKNINFGDSTVLRSFIEDIESKYTGCRCIITEDGKEMTPEQFYNFITAENNEVNSDG